MKQPSLRGCVQSQCTQFSWKWCQLRIWDEVRWGEVRWGEISDINNPLAVICFTQKSTLLRYSHAYRFYTVQKSSTVLLPTNLLKMLTDCYTSFTAICSSKFLIKWCLSIPIHLKCTNALLLILLQSFTAPWIVSGTTWVSRYQKGKTNLDLLERDSEWQWHQLGHMQICTSPESPQTE